MITEKLKKGHLLIAEPSLIGDLSFNRSVILLADHNQEGSIGFIINKPLKYTINDLIPEIVARFKIYNGGPVEQDNLYFIHNIPDLIPNSIEISNGIYWGGDFESTKELINSGLIQSGNFSIIPINLRQNAEDSAESRLTIPVTTLAKKVLV